MLINMIVNLVIGAGGASTFVSTLDGAVASLIVSVVVQAIAAWVMIKHTSVPYARLQFRSGESQEDYARREHARPALIQAYIVKVLFYSSADIVRCTRRE